MLSGQPRPTPRKHSRSASSTEWTKAPNALAARPAYRERDRRVARHRCAARAMRTRQLADIAEASRAALEAARAETAKKSQRPVLADEDHRSRRSHARHSPSTKAWRSSMQVVPAVHRQPAARRPDPCLLRRARSAQGTGNARPRSRDRSLSAGIVGGGTMGAGIAVAMLDAGMPVTMIERDDRSLARGRAHVEKVYDGLVAKGPDERRSQGRRDGALHRVDLVRCAGASRHRGRGRVRGHGRQEGRVRRSSTASASPAPCSRPTPRTSTSTRSRPASRGPRTWWACISSRRPTS